MDTKTHWEEIYKTKTSDAVSWYRPHLETSLALIERAAEGYSASIIDVGGGESTLVDDLLARGYANLTVLDVSQTAVPTVFREKAGASMTVITTCSKLVLLLLVMLAVPTVWAQGPPFQTDDPTPVDLGHYEAYIFGGVDGTPVEIDPVGPAFEFNWGALPNVQLHAILPLGAILPSNDPIYAPGGIGPSAFGLMDMELGVKYGFLKQTKHRPQIGSFTMLEIPTGSYSKGLGVGRVWGKLPIWVQKDVGSWTFDGGMGYTIVNQYQYRDYLYGGFLVKREMSKKLELAVEVFSHAREGFATPQTQSSTLIDAGCYYHFKYPGLQLLFAYGHSVAGQTENYGYLGLYWTWVKNEKKKTTGDSMLSEQPLKNGFH